MKKVVLLISIVLCVSLLVGCANMLEGLTKKNPKLNNLGIPVGEYKCVAATQSNGLNPPFDSAGAFIGTDITSVHQDKNINSSEDGVCFFGGGVLMRNKLVFLPHGEIENQTFNDPILVKNLSWEYKDNALIITSISAGVTTTYKYVLV